MTSPTGVSPGRPSWMVWPCLRAVRFSLRREVLTDGIGFGLLFPATRHAIQRRIMARLERSIQEGEVQVRMAGGEVWARSPDPRSSSDSISSSRSAGE